MADENELMSFGLIDWIERYGDQNGHETYRLTSSEIASLLKTARAAHEYKKHYELVSQSLAAANGFNELFAKENEMLREKLAEKAFEIGVLQVELKEEQTKRHDWAKLKEEVRIAIEAFTDPEGNMPEDTGEFRDLKRVLAKL